MAPDYNKNPKFYVIASGTINSEQIRRTFEIPEITEIIVVGSRDEIPIEERVKSHSQQILEYTLLPKLYEPFYPKQKHSPKGHERWYKYHR